MPSVAVLAADGFETIECLTMVDVMRRGGVRATLVSIMPTREVVSSLQIPVTCDALFDEINFDEYDCVVLPGGLPGATNLRADQRVCDVVCEFAATKHVAAIRAAQLGKKTVLVEKPPRLSWASSTYSRGATPRASLALRKASPKAPILARRSRKTATSSLPAAWHSHSPLHWSCCARSLATRPSRRSPRASNYDFGFAIAAPHRADARGRLQHSRDSRGYRRNAL